MIIKGGAKILTRIILAKTKAFLISKAKVTSKKK
jgi:hypothetical protein